MESYLKLYGPDLVKAIQVLDKIAISDEFSEISGAVRLRTLEDNQKKKKNTGVVVGTYDYAFSWHEQEEPSVERIMELIKKVDESLKPLRVRYEMTSMRGEEEPADIDVDYSVSYLKFIGPGIYGTLIALRDMDLTNLKVHAAGISRGHADYFFVWSKTPSKDEIFELINTIEGILPKDYEVLFNISTRDSLKSKRKIRKNELLITSDRKQIFDSTYNK